MSEWNKLLPNFCLCKTYLFFRNKLLKISWSISNSTFKLFNSKWVETLSFLWSLIFYPVDLSHPKIQRFYYVIQNCIKPTALSLFPWYCFSMTMVYYHQIIALYNTSIDRLMQCVITSSLLLCPRFANYITPLPINSCYILRGTIECVLQYWFWFLPLEQINYGLHKLQLFFIGDIFSGAKGLPGFTSSCSVFHFFCGCNFGKCSYNHCFQNFCDIV